MLNKKKRNHTFNEACAEAVRSFREGTETEFNTHVTCGNIITLLQILGVKRIIGLLIRKLTVLIFIFHFKLALCNSIV